LVVIAILAILAALLLPALARGKAAAKSAACKGNLRQLGIALSAYVGDYDKYPGNAAMYSGGNFQGIWATGMNWLNPYLGGRYDPDELNSRYFFNAGERTVFSCPALPPLTGPMGGEGSRLGYSYNELGTGWKTGGLGLGFTVTVTGYANGGWGPPLGPRRYVQVGDVMKPSDMIAMGDGGGSQLAPNNPSAIVDRGHANAVTLSHSGNANIVFADGHVEQGRGQEWIEASDYRRKRWNNDNRPHPETW
ncbi:MAG: DUF1559 domain-containing protein, partial [Verrucomicrobia bacterium]|nr:DUF1559 domain-containing protein [Verrucomicrobiota bacterium]